MEIPNVKKRKKIADWKFAGLIWETQDEIDLIYDQYLKSELCENINCGKEYKNSKDKCMDHDHDTNKFRNILCRSCNVKIKRNNTSGIPNISWAKVINSWRYQIMINGKIHTKISTDKEWLLNYKLEFEKEHLFKN